MMSRKNPTTEELEAAALYEETGSVRSVMKRFKKDFYISKALIMAGGGRLLGYRRKSKLKKSEIVKMYRTMSVSQIAEKNGTSNSIILRVLWDAGVKMRGQGDCSVGRPRPVIHGLSVEAKSVGMTVDRYMRFKCVAILGSKCRSCGSEDVRVLDINHINGEGRRDDSGNRVKRYPMLLRIASGDTSGVEVLCCNCNRIHEFERGNLKEIPAIRFARNERGNLFPILEKK